MLQHPPSGHFWCSKTRETTQTVLILSSTVTAQVEQFPPGHFWTSKSRKFTKYYNPAWVDVAVASKDLDLPKLKAGFEQAITKRLMTDGVCLSVCLFLPEVHTEIKLWFVV